jgi:hypothetical protein
MRSTLFCLVPVLLLLTGCGSKESSDSVPEAPSAQVEVANPEERLQDQLRTGSFQLQAAADAISDAIDRVGPLAASQDGQTREALQAIRELLDGSGALVSEYADEPPTEDELRVDPALYDEERLRAIEAAQAAMEMLREAENLVRGLLGSGPPERERRQLEQIQSPILEALEAVAEGIRGMGGRL